MLVYVCIAIPKRVLYAIKIIIITWFGTVYAFHKLLRGLLSIICPKPGYIA